MGEPIFDVALTPEDIPGLGAAAVKAVGRFMDTMEKLRDAAEGSSVGDLLEQTLADSGYIDALQAERTIESEGRLENLEELVSVAREYDSSADEPSVEEFLQQVALFSEQDGLSDDDGIVTLMTLHNAKGLEYDTVFMLGMEDGVFPHSRSIEAGDIEEERRLCYVGRHARAAGAVHDPRAHAGDVRRAASGTCRAASSGRSRPSSPTPPSSPRRARSPARGAAPRPRRRRCSGSSPGPAATFALGDDVTHVKFGDGVVVGVEPGGLVVVRFASDGSERKLMADYAPLKKRG